MHQSCYLTCTVVFFFFMTKHKSSKNANDNTTTDSKQSSRPHLLSIQSCCWRCLFQYIHWFAGVYILSLRSNHECKQLTQFRHKSKVAACLWKVRSTFRRPQSQFILLLQNLFFNSNTMSGFQKLIYIYNLQCWWISIIYHLLTFTFLLSLANVHSL